MKNLILLLSLVSFAAWSQVPPETGFRSKLRDFISKYAGPQWSDKFLGKLPETVVEMALPEIPKNLKSSTDVSSYIKEIKPETEYEKLPPERLAQFDRSFVEELFLVTRKTEPKDEDLSTWMNNLQQGGSREAVYQALVLDEVYATLENLSEKPSARLLDYCLRFSKKFYGITYTEEGLKQFNLYTLKRTITEKGLDLLEFYEGKNLEEFHRWYAIYSSDVAKEYGPLFKSKLRTDTDPKYHFEWAKGMPLQHVKSEFIIKTHLIMNQLQLLQ